MRDVENAYIDLVAIKRIGTYSQAATFSGKNANDIKNYYAKNGGIEKFIADQLGLTLKELCELKSADSVIEKREKIDKLFKNQFSSNTARKKGFSDFEKFYTWYLDQNDQCYFCKTHATTLENLFNSNKLNSTKFNATLHIIYLHMER